MDEALARRREVANRIRVKASPARMSMEEFAKHFLDEHVVVNRSIVESTTQSMFCDACASDMGNGAQLLRQLHVTIEDDPLRNFWKLATVKCFGCGFEEIISLDKPDFQNEVSFDRFVDVWEHERKKFHEAMKQREQAMNVAAIQAQQAEATLSKMSTEDYVTDPRFEIIGVSVKKNDEPAKWMHGTQEVHITQGLEQKLGKQGLADLLKDSFKG